MISKKMDTVKVPSKVQEGPLIKKFLQNKIKKAGCKQGVMAAVNAKEGEQEYQVAVICNFIPID